MKFYLLQSVLHLLQEKQNERETKSNTHTTGQTLQTHFQFSIQNTNKTNFGQRQRCQRQKQSAKRKCVASKSNNYHQKQQQQARLQRTLRSLFEFFVFCLLFLFIGSLWLFQVNYFIIILHNTWWLSNEILNSDITKHQKKKTKTKQNWICVK